jgi:hypothetical protein
VTVPEPTYAERLNGGYWTKGLVRHWVSTTGAA